MNVSVDFSLSFAVNVLGEILGGIPLWISSGEFIGELNGEFPP